MILVFIFALIVLLLLISLTSYITLFQNTPQYDVDMWTNVVEYERSITDYEKKTKIVVDADNNDTKQEFIGKDENNSNYLSYLKDSNVVDNYSDIRIQDLRANKALDSSEAYNKNSFFLDFNLVPIEDFNSFHIYFQDKKNNFTTTWHNPNIVVSMKEYNIWANWDKINAMLKEQKELAEKNKIIGYTNSENKKYNLSNNNIFIPEKNLTLDRDLKISNFYETRFKKWKLYKIRIMLLLNDAFSSPNESPTFPIVIGVNENSNTLKENYTRDIKEFVTSNNIQVMQSNTRNKKFNMHSVRVYNKGFLNKIGEIKY